MTDAARVAGPWPHQIKSTTQLFMLSGARRSSAPRYHCAMAIPGLLVLLLRRLQAPSDVFAAIRRKAGHKALEPGDTAPQPIKGSSKLQSPAT